MLTRILFELQHRANKQPTVTQRARLSGGLIIEVAVTNNGTKLRLAREKQVPSNQEFRTILNHWPGIVDPKEIMRSRSGSMNYIDAVIVESPIAENPE